MVRALILALVLVAAASASEYVSVTMEDSRVLLGWLNRGNGRMVLGYYNDHSIVDLDTKQIVKVELADAAKKVLTPYASADKGPFRAEAGEAAPMPTAADIAAGPKKADSGKPEKPKPVKGKP